MPENNFQERRVENRRLYLVEKRNHELKFTRQIQKAIAKYDHFVNLMDFLFNQGRLLETAKSYFSSVTKLTETKELDTPSLYKWYKKAFKDLKEGKGDYIYPELKPLLKETSNIPLEFIRCSLRKQ